MNERQWRDSADPEAMLKIVERLPETIYGIRVKVEGNGPYQISERKLRLFACGCARLAGTYPECTIEANENGDVKFCKDLAKTIHSDLPAYRYCMAQHRAEDEGLFGQEHRKAVLETYKDYGKQEQADVLRCIVGNPFVRAPVLWAAGLPSVEWISENVLAVAGTLYEEGRFTEALVLADVLMDSGCPEMVECPYCAGNKERTQHVVGQFGAMLPCRECKVTGEVPNPMLTHLMMDETHFKGCHVFDAILNKE